MEIYADSNFHATNLTEKKRSSSARRTPLLDVKNRTDLRLDSLSTPQKTSSLRSRRSKAGPSNSVSTTEVTRDICTDVSLPQRSDHNIMSHSLHTLDELDVGATVLLSGDTDLTPEELALEGMEMEGLAVNGCSEPSSYQKVNQRQPGDREPSIEARDESVIQEPPEALDGSSLKDIIAVVEGETERLIDQLIDQCAFDIARESGCRSDIPAPTQDHCYHQAQASDISDVNFAAQYRGSDNPERMKQHHPHTPETSTAMKIYPNSENCVYDTPPQAGLQPTEEVQIWSSTPKRSYGSSLSPSHLHSFNGDPQISAACSLLGEDLVYPENLSNMVNSCLVNENTSNCDPATTSSFSFDHLLSIDLSGPYQAGTVEELESPFITCPPQSPSSNFGEECGGTHWDPASSTKATNSIAEIPWKASDTRPQVFRLVEELQKVWAFETGLPSDPENSVGSSGITSVVNEFGQDESSKDLTEAAPLPEEKTGAEVGSSVTSQVAESPCQADSVCHCEPDVTDLSTHQVIHGQLSNLLQTPSWIPPPTKEDDSRKRTIMDGGATEEMPCYSSEIDRTPLVSDAEVMAAIQLIGNIVDMGDLNPVSMSSNQASFNESGSSVSMYWGNLSRLSQASLEDASYSQKTVASDCGLNSGGRTAQFVEADSLQEINTCRITDAVPEADPSVNNVSKTAGTALGTENYQGIDISMNSARCGGIDISINTEKYQGIDTSMNTEKHQGIDTSMNTEKHQGIDTSMNTEKDQGIDASMNTEKHQGIDTMNTEKHQRIDAFMNIDECWRIGISKGSGKSVQGVDTSMMTHQCPGVDVSMVTDHCTVADVSMVTEAAPMLNCSVLAVPDYLNQETMTEREAIDQETMTEGEAVATASSMTPLKLGKHGTRLTAEEVRRQHPRVIANHIDTTLLANQRLEKEAKTSVRERNFLKSSLKDRKTELRDRDETIVRLEAELSEMQQKSGHQEMLLEEERLKCWHAEEMLQSSTAELEERCQDLEKLRMQAEREFAEELQQIQAHAEETSYRKQFESAQQRIRELQAVEQEYVELLGELDTTFHLQNRLAQEVDMLNKAASGLATHNLKLNVENESLKKRCVSKEVDLDMMRYENQELKLDSENLSDLLERSNQRVAELEALLKTSNFQLAEQSEQKSSLAKENEELYDSKLAMLVELSAQQDSLSRASEEHQAVLDQLRETEQALAKERGILAAGKEMHAKMKTQFEETNLKLEMEVQHLEKLLDVSELKLGAQEQELYECREQLSALQEAEGALAESRQDVESGTAALHCLQEQMEALLVQLHDKLNLGRSTTKARLPKPGKSSTPKAGRPGLKRGEEGSFVAEVLSHVDHNESIKTQRAVGGGSGAGFVDMAPAMASHSSGYRLQQKPRLQPRQQSNVEFGAARPEFGAEAAALLSPPPHSQTFCCPRPTTNHHHLLPDTLLLSSSRKSLSFSEGSRRQLFKSGTTSSKNEEERGAGMVQQKAWPSLEGYPSPSLWGVRDGPVVTPGYAKIRNIPTIADSILEGERGNPEGAGRSPRSKTVAATPLADKVEVLEQLMGQIVKALQLTSKASQLTLQDAREELEFANERLKNETSAKVDLENELERKSTLIIDLNAKHKELNSRISEMTKSLLNFHDQNFQISRLEEDKREMKWKLTSMEGQCSLLSDHLEAVVKKLDASMAGQCTTESSCVQEVLMLKKERHELMMKLLSERDQHRELGEKAVRRMKILERNWKTAEDEVKRLDELVEQVRTSCVTSQVQSTHPLILGIVRLIDGKISSLSDPDNHRLSHKGCEGSSHNRSFSQSHSGNESKSHNRSFNQSHSGNESKSHNRSFSQSHSGNESKSHNRRFSQSHSGNESKSHNCNHSQDHSSSESKSHNRNGRQSHNGSNIQYHTHSLGESQDCILSQSHNRSESQTHNFSPNLRHGHGLIQSHNGSERHQNRDFVPSQSDSDKENHSKSIIATSITHYSKSSIEEHTRDADLTATGGKAPSHCPRAASRYTQV